MEIDRIVVGAFQVNAYVVRLEGAREAVVIDPGDDSPAILSLVGERGLEVTHIFNTHGHGDHIGANGDVKAAFPEAKIYVHGRDAHMLDDPRANLSTFFGYAASSPPADLFFEGNTDVRAAGITFRVEHLPGHSSGSVCLIADTEPPVVFVGDTLFAGTIGRTDFPGGNMEMLVAGIRDRILSLPDETQVYPGHGETTTVGAERTGNYFVCEDSGAGRP